MREVALDLSGGGVVLLLLVVLADVGLDHADAGEVLLGALVQGVVLAEDATEDRGDLAHHGEKRHGEHRDDHHEDDGQPARHRVGGDEGADEHERGADGGADEHHVGHLHVHDVGGEARHERGAREAVDHREGEGLDVVEHVLAEVLGKADGGLRAGEARRRAEGERDERHEGEKPASGEDLREVRARLDRVDEVGGEQRDQHLEDHLAEHQQGSGDGGAPVLADAPHEMAHDLGVGHVRRGLLEPRLGG